jgi:uncharacterized protein (TIGR02466 family)
MEKIEHLWWPTPVWEVKTDFDKFFNERLSKELYQSKITKQKDNTNEVSIFHNIENDPSLIYLPKLKQKLLEIITSCARDYFPVQFYPNFRFTRAWCNSFQPGKLLKPHCHGSSLIAATYYIKTPENSGDLVLIDPLGGVNFGWTTEPGMSCGKSKSIKPEEGKLVFFPGYVLHMVEENKSKEPRTAISMNISGDF